MKLKICLTERREEVFGVVFSDGSNVEVVPVYLLSSVLHLLSHVGHSATQLMPIRLQYNPASQNFKLLSIFSGRAIKFSY